jgi:outer membrane protein
MSRYLALGCVGIGLMVSPLLGSFATGAVPQNPKIGVINIDEVFATSPAGKRASESFDKTRKDKQSALDKKQDDLRKESADLQKQAAVLKPEVLKQKQEELQKKLIELQQTAGKLERELNEARDKILGDLMKQADPKIADIAKAEGVTIILERRSVVWADPAVDLTKQLTAKLP